uniref:Exoribonuclease phosphorolytic domain-containing protein n=1 Tax=Pyramimonas obovata TaxID=1411642 RepID=A0A7S0QYE2_9CHLO|mmetsp:Transcript_18256/g.39910  ORF Transcript_18256/g.39910 Transcript_18256/m.39910 type:complete len:241 (+) Transcript_18256:372-1094(+)
MGEEGVSRDDGRQDNQIRTLACERGLLNRADGSARWSQDSSSVLAAVYGPKSVPGYKEDPEKAKIEVLFKPKTDLPGTPERELEQVIARTVESVIIAALHPRTGISIILQVLQDDGAILACAINAACAALVDAGIAMNGLVAATCVAISPDGRLLLDPLHAEAEGATAVATLAFASTKPLPDKPRPAEPTPIVCSVTSGCMTAEQYFQCVDVGRSSCERVAAFFQLSLERYQRGWQMFAK